MGWVGMEVSEVGGPTYQVTKTVWIWNRRPGNCSAGLCLADPEARGDCNWEGTTKSLTLCPNCKVRTNEAHTGAEFDGSNAVCCCG